MSTSNQLVERSAQQRAAFMQSGYLIVDGGEIWGSDRAQIVERCHREIQRLADYGYGLVDSALLAQEGRKLSVKDSDERSRGCRFVFDRAKRSFVRSNQEEKQAILKLANGVGTFSEELGAATRHPNMLKVFANLLGANEFEQIICQVHFKEPHDGATFAPHFDFQNRIGFDPNWKDVNGFGSYVVAVIAVDDHTIANGCLYTVPGIDPSKEPSRDKAVLAQLISTAEITKGIAMEMKAGDVLFMHPYNLHWSAENTSGISRFTLLAGMCSVGATAVDYPGTMCKLGARRVQAGTSC